MHICFCISIHIHSLIDIHSTPIQTYSQYEYHKYSYVKTYILDYVKTGTVESMQSFPGQLAFCKKAVVGLAARRIFLIVQWSRVMFRKLKVYFPKHVLFIINTVI